VQIAASVLVVLVALCACQPSRGDPVERGKRVYVANCIACHNPDPTREGTLGPAVAGSSLALVEARVLRGEYPPGYTPKRSSALMPAQLPSGRSDARPVSLSSDRAEARAVRTGSTRPRTARA
jgi:mono/diheme cytochrome c family protein